MYPLQSIALGPKWELSSPGSVHGLVAKEEAYHYPGSKLGKKLRRMRSEKRGENWYRRMRLALAKEDQSKEEFKVADAKLKKARDKFVDDLVEFEEHVFDQLLRRTRLKREGVKRNPKWIPVLTELRAEYRAAGTHKLWLAADTALGE